MLGFKFALKTKLGKRDQVRAEVGKSLDLLLHWPRQTRTRKYDKSGSWYVVTTTTEGGDFKDQDIRTYDSQGVLARICETAGDSAQSVSTSWFYPDRTHWGRFLNSENY